MAALDKKMDVFYRGFMPTPLPSFISKRVLRGRYLFFKPRPQPSPDLSVTYAGWEECDPSYTIERDGFRHFAFEFIVGGSWELTTPHKKWKVGPGTIFAYGPGVTYSMKAFSPSGLSKYFVGLSGRDVRHDLARAGFKGAAPRRVRHMRWLQDIFDQMIEASRLRSAARKLVCDHLLGVLLARIPDDTRTTSSLSHAAQSYEQCRQFLTENYLRVNSMAAAAQATGVSAAYLSRLFNRFDTETPKLFLTRMRMNHAAELISRQSFSVKSAAHQVGFDDPYHFSRAFKRIHGVAPRHFAKL